MLLIINDMNSLATHCITTTNWQHRTKFHIFQILSKISDYERFEEIGHLLGHPECICTGWRAWKEKHPFLKCRKITNKLKDCDWICKKTQLGKDYPYILFLLYRCCTYHFEGNVIICEDSSKNLSNRFIIDRFRTD